MKRAAAVTVVVAIGLAGCESEAPAGDAAGGDASGCERPSLDATWLESELMQTVADLAVSPRARTAERDAARTYLVTKLAAQGWATELHTYAGGANVIATVPPTTPDRVRIVVGAHFDTVDGSPGANDNATGVAVVLAIGRFLQATPCRTAPVTLALFDQEEAGLFGSRAYAQSLLPTTVRAAITVDQVGWDGDGDRRFEIEQASANLETRWRAAASAVGVALDFTPTGGTDHDSFRDRGIDAAGLTEEYAGGDTTPHRHTVNDTAATVDIGYLALATKLTTQFVLDDVMP